MVWGSHDFILYCDEDQGGSDRVVWTCPLTLREGAFWAFYGLPRYEKKKGRGVGLKVICGQTSKMELAAFITLAIQPSSSTLRYLTKRNDNIYSYRNLYASVYHPNCKQPQKSINWWISKKIIVNGYNGILLCNKEELFIGTRNSVKKSLSTALTEARYKGYICYGYI